MELIALKLPLIKKNDLLLEIIIKEINRRLGKLEDGDIIVIAEKIIATSQGRVLNLNDVKEISQKARKLAINYDMDERYVELILREASMIIGGMHHVILSKVDDFLIANSGIDQSNAGPNSVVLLPKDLKKTAKEYREFFCKNFSLNKLGVIISDSRVQPLRKGTIGIAIATAGFEPIEDLRGQPDLFGRPLEITMRAIADDLASAAQILLSESNQSTPVVVIKGAEVNFTENPLITPEMAPEECLYMNIFAKYLHEKINRS
jgi:coenzyme F420-0:L-glutamate ligase/coenzyme F420-1:gamma-L-glutamate ligase